MMLMMPERVFAAWQHFFAVYPFGEDVRDGRTARVIATIAAAAGAKGHALEPERHMLPAYQGAQPKPKRSKADVDRDLRRAFGIPDA